MLSKTVLDGVGKMGCGCAGRGIAQEYLPRPKPNRAVVAGCGAVIDGGWEDIKFNRLVINHLVEFVVVIQE